MSIASQRQNTEDLRTELDERSPVVMMKDVEPSVLAAQRIVANQNDAANFLYLNGTCG
ncbi:MAG: hypothetical protein ACJAU6_003407 [Alphaproteobacteria bacterium]|jgi:hypothetical protein